MKVTNNHQGIQHNEINQTIFDAIGANVAGQIGSVVAGGVVINLVLNMLGWN